MLLLVDADALNAFSMQVAIAEFIESSSLIMDGKIDDVDATGCLWMHAAAHVRMYLPSEPNCPFVVLAAARI
jgi:hypothetical protein